MSANKSPPLRFTDSPLSRGRRWFLISIGLLIALIYAGAAALTDASQTHEALVQLGWSGCTLVPALSILNYLLRFRRWQMLLARLGSILPARLHILYYISGFAFTLSPAKAGEAFRSVYLREHGVAYSDSLAALFVERLLDVVAMAMLASFLAIEHPPYRPLIGGVMVIALLLLVVAHHPYVPRRLQAMADGGRHPLLAAPLATLAGLLRSSQSLLQAGPMASGLALGLAAWGAEGLGLFLICSGLHLNIAVTTAIGIYATASLAGSAAFFLPAGIGGMEFVMTTLLIAHGAPLRSAIIATLICRIATLWLAVLLGICASTVIELRAAPRPLRSAS